MKISEVIEKLNFETVVMSDPNAEVNGCYVGDLLSWVMGRAEADNLWITIMTNINTVAVASLSGVAAIVIAEGLDVPENVIDAATTQGINIVKSQKPIFETSVDVGRLFGIL